MIRESARRVPRWLILVLALLAAEVSYVYVISAGKMTSWPTYSSYYDMLAGGLRAGHLHLSVSPPPALVAKPDPRDPNNIDLWLWDASYYKGEYYLYFGPFPAVALAAVKALFRMRREVGDQFLFFAFVSLRSLFGAVLVARVARRLFDPLPLHLVLAPVMVLAFGNPTLFTAARAGLYETAIYAGQAMLLAGLLLAFDAVSLNAPARRRARALVGAGACWGLALGSRISLAPAIALLAVATAALADGAVRRRDRIRALLLVSAPIAAAVALLLLYNKLRFDRWLEFGVHLQLTTIPFDAHIRYAPANIYSYLLRPLGHTCKFPYLVAPFELAARAFPRWFPVPPRYSTFEPLAGTLLSAPWSWLALLGVASGAAAVARAIRARRRAVTLTPQERARLWCALGFLVAAVVTIAPDMGLLMMTMRYAADGSAGMVLLGTFGVWSLHVRLRDRPWPRRAVALVAIALAALSLAVSFCLGFTGYYDHFARNNHKLYQQLVRKWSHCHHALAPSSDR